MRVLSHRKHRLWSVAKSTEALLNHGNNRILASWDHLHQGRLDYLVQLHGLLEASGLLGLSRVVPWLQGRRPAALLDGGPGKVVVEHLHLSHVVC